MKSLTGKFSSTRGWALLLILFLGAGFLVAACGDEEVPAPTTPTPPPAPPPAPAPEPEPTPEPPATPTGLHVDSATQNSITWQWTAVEGATGYVVQASTDEMFDDTVLGNPETVLFNGVPFTTETSYTATDLETETSLYVRVAAAAGTPAAPLVSTFSTHVTGMTTAVPLAPAPANLRVKERGSDFIEWEWDAVDGVDGYQSQFSTSSGFSDPSAAYHQGMNMTSRRVRLDPETDGYLRVRTYTGTITEPTFGMWSEGSMSSTTEPPAAVKLDAPTGLDATETDDDSITLEWDSVRNAATYEVEQREPGDDWEDASCGGDDNVVEDEECVASDLSEGTDYDFQVRAVPADDDARYTVSDWSDIEETRTSGTGPSTTPTTPTTSGGMGNLNVRWESTATSITWIWDRVAGAKYDFDFTVTAYNDNENPCEAITSYTTTGSSATSATTPSGSPLSGGDVRLLCVRTNNPENLSENLSFAWAVASPAVSTVGTASEKDEDKDDVVDTTSGLTWDTFVVKGGFNYEWRAVEDPMRDDDIKTGTDPDDVQSACDAAKLVIETGDSDQDYSVDEIRYTASPKRHTGYLLCTRYSNSGGTSDWTVPADNAEALTRPATPPDPTVDSTRVNEGTDNTVVAWRIAVRNSVDVPRLPTGFNAKTLVYREKWEDSTDVDSNNVARIKTTKAPTAADCATGTGSQGQFALTAIADANKKTDSSGVVFISGNITRPDYQATRSLGNNRVHLCVQATNATGTGPWRLDSPFTVKQKPAP